MVVCVCRCLPQSWHLHSLPFHCVSHTTRSRQHAMHGYCLACLLLCLCVCGCVVLVVHVCDASSCYCQHTHIYMCCVLLFLNVSMRTSASVWCACCCSALLNMIMYMCPCLRVVWILGNSYQLVSNASCALPFYAVTYFISCSLSLPLLFSSHFSVASCPNCRNPPTRNQQVCFVCQQHLVLVLG